MTLQVVISGDTGVRWCIIGLGTDLALIISIVNRRELICNLQNL